jgi:pimeloyl-ACP methyl ester carboxylesterase
MATATAAAVPPSTIVVGTQTLTACGTSPVAYCGTLEVPLDYAMPAGPLISISYRWYPATSGRPAGTVLPVEGGPGFPSVGSVRGGYDVMYGPLLASRNLLAVDLRGTGMSTPLHCSALQHFSGQASGPAFDVVVKRCAAALDHRWRDAQGNFIRASDLFTSAPAAEDVAAVVQALGVGPVDVYGDSYGSWFAQVFAARFPRLVRSVVLDSSYAVQGLDPWYRSTIDAMPADFDVVCARSLACAEEAPGRSWERIGELAARLRAGPIAGTVPGPHGLPVTLTMDVVGLVDLLNDAAGDPLVDRAIDAAGRALVDEDDPLPLLRLYAERLAFDEDYFGTPASKYSGELYLAVSCLDYPQLFDMADHEPQREAQLAAAENTLPARTFAPFTIAEWLAQNQNTEAYSACVAWPSPKDAQPPIDGGPPFLPAGMPVLILGGELDTWTPPSGVPQVEEEVGAHTRFVELANSTHVVGEGDTWCGSELVRAFVADPGDLDSLDTSCAAAVPAIRAVGVYADQIGNVPPLSASPGTKPSLLARKLAAASVDTAGDAIARIAGIVGRHDVGLYGGTAQFEHGSIVLTSDQLVPGVEVSGRVTTNRGLASARLVVHAPGVGTTELTASWAQHGGAAMATVEGRALGRSVSGQMPAP